MSIVSGSLRDAYWNPELWKCNKLATSLPSFVDPVDGLLDTELEVQPARFGVDCRSLVLLECSHHDGDVVRKRAVISKVKLKVQ